MALLLTLDFGWLARERVEAYATEALGRGVRIEGPLHVTLGKTIQISAENLSLASTDWSTARELVNVRQLELRVDAWSLLDDAILVDTVTINGLLINLERSLDGSRNWSADLATRVVELLFGQSMSLPAIVARLEVIDSVVSYAGPDRFRSVILTAPQTTVRLEDSTLYHAALDGELNATPLSISLDARSVGGNAGQIGADIEFAAVLGTVEIEGTAAFASLFEPSLPTARLELKGPSIEDLTDILGVDRITSGPFDASLTIEPAGEDMRFSLSGDMGEFAVMATGQFDDLRRFDVEFSASGPSANAITELLDWPEVPEAMFDASGTVRLDGSYTELEDVSIVIGETQLVVDGQFLDLPNPSLSNARLQISGPDLGQFDNLLELPGPLEGSFDLIAEIRSVDLGGAVLDITGTVGDLSTRLQGQLTDAADLVGSELSVSLSGEDLSWVARAAGHDIELQESFTLEMSLNRSPEATIIERGVVTLGEDRFTFSGHVDDGTPAEWMLELDAMIPDMTARLAGFGMERSGFLAGGTAISATIRGASPGYVLDDATVSVAGMDITLSGRLGPLPELEGSDLAVHVAGSSLATVYPSLEELLGWDGPFSTTATARIGAGEVALEEAVLEIDGVVLNGSLALTLDQQPWRGSFSLETSSPAAVGHWPMLAELVLAKGKPFVLRVTGDWTDSVWNIRAFDMGSSGASLSAGGYTTGPPSFDDTALRVDWATPSLAGFSSLVGRELPDEPASVQFELAGNAKQFAIRNLTGTSGGSDVRGTIGFSAGQVLAIEADLRSDRIDLRPYLAPDPEVSVEKEDERLSRDGRWLPDILVQIDELEGREIAASILAGEILTRRRTLDNVTLEASILDGVLRLDKFDLEADGGTLHGEFTLRSGETAPEIGISMSGENISIGLDALSPVDLSALPQYTADLSVTASGHSFREMAATMSGYLYLVGGPGKVRSTPIRFYTRDFFSELLDALNPFRATDPDLDLSCSVILAGVEEGTLIGDPAIVMQSDRVTVYADALIDLESEIVDVNLRTVPVRGLGISLSNLISPYVKIGGTLSKPSVAFDPEGALIEGGFAVATGGASLLAENLWERFLSAGDPCARAISYADEQLQEFKEKFGPAVSAALQ